MTQWDQAALYQMLPIWEFLFCSHSNNIHSHTPSQVNIKLHTKILFTSHIFTQYIISRFHKKKSRHTEGQKTQFEETGEGEPDRDMAEMLQLSDKKFKAVVINVLRAVIEKVNNMQEQMGNVSRQMESLKQNQKEIQEIKNTVTETNNTFDRLFNRLDTAEKNQ